MKIKKIISTVLISVFSFALLQSPSFAAIVVNNTLELNVISEDESKIILGLNLINPTNQKISSVQSWLKFDERILKGADIDTGKSPFNFGLPGETNFEGNIIKIGRASLTPETTTKNKIFIANISFEKKTQEATEVNFHNYQIGEKGNVSVQVLDNGIPVNTISKKPFGVVIGDKPVGVKTVQNNSYEQKEPGRPRNINVSTNGNSVKLKWDLDGNAKFYHIYYGKISGKYINRKKIGKFNTYKIRGLEKGERYYFALKAIGNSGTEGDYSNEVSVIVGKNNIERQGNLKANVFQKEKTYGNNSKKYMKIRQNVKTGGATLIASIFISLSLGLLFLFRKKLFKKYRKIENS